VVAVAVDQPGNIIGSSVYSWLTWSRPRSESVEPYGSGRKST
jgi:hypothetical protein